MKRSIVSNEECCYICRIEHKITLVTEEHHIFYGPNRKWSTKYKLTVRLCPSHHRTGEEAVHRFPNEGWDLYLKKIGQKAFEENYPDLSFRDIFGRYYIN